MSLIYLRKANRDHLEQIMNVVHDAQENLNAAGIDQWKNGYPDKFNILSDIDQNSLYEIMFEKQIAGIITIQDIPEPNYKTLSGGKWLGSDNYATIHRLAIDSSFSHQGLGKMALISALSLIREQQITSVRVDTHRKNQRVQHLVTQLGFKYRGVIHIVDPHGDLDNDAYELIME